jgi:dihydropteroate synthase
MGILNVTPDSFSDGGRYESEERARARIDELLEEGAQVIDVGGESTRPGHTPVPDDEQVRRTRAAIAYAASRGAVVSIDTASPVVAARALDAGASVVNDVSCLRGGDELARIAASRAAALVLMHSREPMSTVAGYAGTPEEAYEDVVGEVAAEWLAAEGRAERAGVPRSEVFLDPGIGFNKSSRHCERLIERLERLAALGFPLVVGPSRKSFLAARVSSAATRRLGGTVAASLACALRGADVLRVHDVLEVRQALEVARAVGLAPLEGPFGGAHA